MCLDLPLTVRTKPVCRQSYGMEPVVTAYLSYPRLTMWGGASADLLAVVTHHLTQFIPQFGNQD